MTLIVTFAASPFVVMVADRRLTWPNGRIADDDANKVVMFCNQMAIGYTGQARIEGKGTDEWLAHELGGLPTRCLAAAWNHLNQRATEVFRRPSLKGKFQSFMGVGYTPKTETSTARSFHIKCSNMYKKGVLMDKPLDAFKLEYQTHEGAGVGCYLYRSCSDTQRT